MGRGVAKLCTKRTNVLIYLYTKRPDVLIYLVITIGRSYIFKYTVPTIK